MNLYKITDNVQPLPEDVNLGDTVQLTQGEPIEVVACEETGVKMLNIDADEIQKGDLPYIKLLGLTISNPDTERPVAIGVDYVKDTFGHKVASFLGGLAVGESLRRDDNDDDDDSSFFSSSGSFGGGSSFGGFGGGSFSGGGASGSF